MVIDLIVTKTDDGYTAEVPSIKGCESWAHNEDEVIEKSLELVQFYLKLPDKKKIIVDKARREENVIIYKLVFDK
ncbi:type II toxin-antitoxin system HicB family antitoxin [Bacteroidota bacterium]